MNDQMNQAQKMNQSQGVINPPFLSQSQPPQMMMMSKKPPTSNQSRLRTMMNAGGPIRETAQSRMMIRNYGVWPPPQNMVEAMNFQNVTKQQGFGVSKPRNWIGKKGKKDKRKPPMAGGRPIGGPAVGTNVSGGPGGVVGGYRGGAGAVGGYKPPSLNELQNQNRIKARRFYPNKRNNNRFAPYAPRNTTSFLIRAKKSGGIASLVSPCPVTPAVLPTPIFSPSTEVLGETAKEEWGVDGYGSMKGLIRLRSPGNEEEQINDDLEEEEGGGSSESDVEEHLEVERRLDQDLSRFEMVYPNYNGDHNNLLENRVDDQDSHILQLEEENLILKERLFLMDRELGDLRRRLQFLESQNPFLDLNEEVVDNVSDNESDEAVEENCEECGENEFVKDVCVEEPENDVMDKLCEVRSIDAVDEEAMAHSVAVEDRRTLETSNNI